MSYVYQLSDTQLHREVHVLSLSRHGPELAAGCSEGQVVILSTEGWEELGEDSCWATWATGRVKRHLINEDVAI